MAEAVFAARPNFVLILADDLGYGDVGYQGGDVPTPNIDSIAVEDLLFDCSVHSDQLGREDGNVTNKVRPDVSGLLQQIPDDVMAFDACEAKVETLKLHGQSFVVDAEGGVIEQTALFQVAQESGRKPICPPR